MSPRGLVAEIEQLDSAGRSSAGDPRRALSFNARSRSISAAKSPTRACRPTASSAWLYERPAHRAAVALAYRSARRARRVLRPLLPRPAGRCRSRQGPGAASPWPSSNAESSAFLALSTSGAELPATMNLADCRRRAPTGAATSGLRFFTVMTVETPQMMKVMTVSPSSPTLLPRGEKGAS
jgi:hypothetical protein